MKLGGLVLLLTACQFTASELPAARDATTVADAPLCAEDAPATDGAPRDGAGVDARRIDARVIDARGFSDATASSDAPAGAVDAATGDALCVPPTAECDGDDATMCETRLDTVSDCGACGRACVARGGSNSCVSSASGWDCVPQCDPDHADCDGDPVNGCELDVPSDIGEPDDDCPGTALPDLDEGQSRVAARRIFPAGDVDVFAITLREAGEHLCTPGNALAFTALVTLAPPPGAQLRLRRLGDETECKGGSTPSAEEICFEWTGKCDLPVEHTVYFKVDAAASQSHCSPYTATVKFCRAGASCAECRAQ